MTALLAPDTLPAPVEVSDAERVALLEVARSALTAAVREDPRQVAHAVAARATGALAGRRGAAFVTLTVDGELRGCVGILDPSRPLAESVAGAAVGAALSDLRFLPVREEELPSIWVEVSVLGPLVPLEDPLEFRPGIDGLVVSRGYARGLLLPEVATTHGFGAAGMLEATCRKAGLPPDAWRDPATRILVFRTERFGGPALA